MIRRCRVEYSAASTDTYLEKKLVPRGEWAGHPALEPAFKRALEEGVPDIRVSAMQGQYLSVLAKGLGAEKILEIGTLWG